MSTDPLRCADAARWTCAQAAGLSSYPPHLVSHLTIRTGRSLTVTDSRSAAWGGHMTQAAKAKGILGAVIDGGCRDMAEHLERDYPVNDLYSTTSVILPRPC